MLSSGPRPPAGRQRRKTGPQARSIAKRALILDTAMRYFAEHGFATARVEDIAAEIDISKGSVFQHFGSKEGLFFEVFKKAILSLPSYLDAPAEIRDKGFFETVRFWLSRTEHLVHRDWVPFRISILGGYGADVDLKRQIELFMADNDPYGTIAFVRWGIERGEVRDDVDIDMLVYTIDWMTERFQDAIMAGELDPGLFREPGNGKPRHIGARIEQFLMLLRGAIGARAPRPPEGKRP